jgi:putative transposase
VEIEIRDEMQKVALDWPAYGSRRIALELQRPGFEINHKRVLRMMRQDNLLCVRQQLAKFAAQAGLSLIGLRP